MGYMTALSLAEEMDLDQGLRIHLQSNHYPPVPLTMVGPCKEAIAKANSNEWEASIKLPKGVSCKGSNFASVLDIVNAHHLTAFLEN